MSCRSLISLLPSQDLPPAMIYATNSFLYRKFLSCSHPVEYQVRHAPHGYFDWRAFIHSEEPIPDDVIDSVYQAAGDQEPFAYEDQLCAQVRADYAKLGQYPRDIYGLAPR